MSMRVFVIILGILTAASNAPQGAAPVHFRELTARAGLTTIPHVSAEKRYLFETVGGGVALFDCDNDGKLDIVVVGDSTVGRYLQGGDPMVTLYRQDSDLHFTDITQVAGLTVRGWGMGVAVGDYDNDGLPDLYVTGYGHNVLYHNLGGCKFEDVTEKAGVSGGGFSVGAAWADYDRDGHLDLFVARYVHSDIHNLPKPGQSSFDYKGISIEVPQAEGETAFLYHNKGNGTFEEVSVKAGVHNASRQRGMGVEWGDYDNDGWPDLFVTNDVGPNFLYHNLHNGTFEEVGFVSGTALSDDGRTMGNMAGDFGDFDRDGKLDLIVTRYGLQPLSLYRNQMPQGFSDVAWNAQLSSSGYSPVRWGVGFADFDNDGWPDILVANGNVSTVLEALPHELPYREPIQLFHNRGDRTFEEIGGSAGFNDGVAQSRRGVAFGDLNNDGNVDVVVYNVGTPPSVFVNETRESNHRVLFRLIGTKSNRAAIGARITITTTRMKQIDEVRGGGGYLSSSDQRLHFGLGLESTIKKIKIDWPSGQRDEFNNVPADAIYTIMEGKGIQNTIRLTPLEDEPTRGRQAPAKSLSRENANEERDK